MHNGALRKWALALTFWLALHMSSLKAQIFTNDLPLQADTTGTNPVDFEFRADGTLIAKGIFSAGSLLSGDQGDGTRMLWFPALGAFRAGTVSTGLSLGDGPWDAANIGLYSVAFGYNTTASGYYSSAFGYEATASAPDTVAMGYQSMASGARDVALGHCALASGGDSFSAGVYTSSTGWASSSMGCFAAATGSNSTAFGLATTASGYGSTTSGCYSIASGTFSTAAGLSTTASAYASFVVGAFNVGGGNASAWVATDPLFEVGNGSGSRFDNPPIGNPDATGPSDALVVYKNGNAVLQGTLQVAPGGDIPMYSGN